MPVTGCVVEQRAAALQNEAQSLVHQRAFRRVDVAVGRDPQVAQVMDKFGRVTTAEMGGVPHRSPLEEAEQMVRGRAVTCDGLDGGTENLFMVLQPTVA